MLTYCFFIVFKFPTSWRDIDFNVKVENTIADVKSINLKNKNKEFKVNLGERNIPIKVKINQKQVKDQYVRGNEKSNIKDNHVHSLAGLSCDEFGGPTDEMVSHIEMVYWNDIPSDSDYKSPFYDENKYLTFETDHGGWNNVRMAMETVLVAAHAMGRTLVLPPEHDMYLLSSVSFLYYINDF